MIEKDYREVADRVEIGEAFRSKEIGEIASALALAQLEMVQPKKNKIVDFTNKAGRRIFYKYADLPDCIESIKALNRQGIAVSQPIKIKDGLLSITTILMHKSGQYLGAVCSWPISDPDPKSAGSLITYLRRYALAIAGIAAEEDDDSQAHMGSDEKDLGKTKQAPKAEAAPVPKSENPDPNIYYEATREQKETIALMAEKVGVSEGDKPTLKSLSEWLLKSKVPMDRLAEAIDQYFNHT